MLELGEIDRYDGAAAVGKLDGLEIVVAEAASSSASASRCASSASSTGAPTPSLIEEDKAAPSR